jgi:hypothetical protein
MGVFGGANKEKEMHCVFCGHDPFHYVDVGIGMVAAAVDCCDLGYALYSQRDPKVQKLAALKRSPSPRKQARFKRLMMANEEK